MSDEKLKKDSLDERLRKVHIPTPKELIDSFLNRKKNYGLLFADGNVIMYAPFVNGKSGNGIFEVEGPLKIKDTDDTAWALLSTQKDIYSGDVKGKVCSLFGKKSSSEREYVVNTLTFFGGRVLDAGNYGLYDSLTNKCLITEQQMENKEIDCINSLCVFDEKLHALVHYDNAEHGVVEVVKKDDGSFDFGKETKHYDVRHFTICQSFFLSDGKFLSCLNLNFLDLDNKKIKGIEHTNKIYNVVLLSYQKDYANVAYSGTLNSVEFARIDLKNCKAKTKTLIPRLSDSVYALEVIRSKEMHEKLMSIGKELK